MGLPVMILGASGSGKTASLRGFEPGTLGMINVAKKPLPFKTQMKPMNTDSYDQIKRALQQAKVRSIAIDDAQYLLANEFMRSAKVNGYQKFVDIALNCWNLIQFVSELPEDKIVYFLWHSEIDERGFERAKTIGKMLNEKITLEGMFTIVLKTVVKDGGYYFSTQTNGADTVKSPMGLFDAELIENDLAMVDRRIREYYGSSGQV